MGSEIFGIRSDELQFSECTGAARDRARQSERFSRLSGGFSRLSNWRRNSLLLVAESPYAPRERVPEMRRTRLLEGASQQSRSALLLANGVVEIDGLTHDESMGWVRVQTVRVHDLGALVVSAFEGERSVGEAQPCLDLLTQLIVGSFYRLLFGIKNGFGFIDSLKLEQYENAWYENREIARVEFKGTIDIGQGFCVAGDLEFCVRAKC